MVKIDIKIQKDCGITFCSVRIRILNCGRPDTPVSVTVCIIVCIFIIVISFPFIYDA